MTVGPRRSAETRLEDVAAEAGVSRTSASRVMLGQGKVSEDTRRRVRAAADRLGYVTNVMASELASGTSSTIGLLLRDAANPAYGLLFTQLQKAAHDADLTLVSMTISADDHGRAQVASLHRLMGMRVAGLIVATGGVTSEQLEPFRTRIPIVRAGRPETTDVVHAVSYDEEDAGRRLAEHIASLGHTDVAVQVTGEEDSYPEYVRGTTMLMVLGEHGVRVRRVDVGTRSDGVADTVALVAAGAVTAVMCPSDLRQLNVLRALAGAGFRVPQDVSVSGCDGILPGADLMGLTTFRIPVEEVARRAVAHMAHLLGQAPPSGIVNERVRGLLVPGRTAGPPPAGADGPNPASAGGTPPSPRAEPDEGPTR
ncbi:LacI family DNA-binding transcriptional regulator [Occultella gossypii]|uniref:LacI family DNA-binding transcriptional regulator n=1 Tax=Occultella gossypii TaxID=2800820 RepID=A0ABS7S379_9MICO|nr:LacI family DNA-binding transcriptional regulator [Occultella gossypii]MBZ2194765.1 LacI family DNA-binding transcriptional regulator [Occultella gossypii]